jgi:hypothetical protein
MCKTNEHHFWVHMVKFDTNTVHCKERFLISPSPAGVSLTKLSLVGIFQISPDQGEFG